MDAKQHTTAARPHEGERRETNIPGAVTPDAPPHRQGATALGKGFDPFAGLLDGLRSQERPAIARHRPAAKDAKATAQDAQPMAQKKAAEANTTNVDINVDINVDKHGWDPFGGIIEGSGRFSISDSLRNSIDRAVALLRDHDRTRTHEPVSERTEAHYRRLMKGMITRLRNGGHSVAPPELHSRTASTYYNRRAAIVWAASEGTREALRTITDVSLRRGGAIGLPGEFANEVGAASRVGWPSEDRDLASWKRACERLGFWLPLLARYRPGVKENLDANAGRPNLWRDAVEKGEMAEGVLEADHGDRDSRRRQADLARKVPDWKLRLWPLVEGWDSAMRDALAVSFAVGPRPAELAKGASVSASSGMRIVVDAVKNDNGHGSLARIYDYAPTAKMNPWELFLRDRAIAEGGRLSAVVQSEKTFSESVKELLARSGIWKPFLWRNALKRVECRDLLAVAVGMCLGTARRDEHLAKGIAARSDGKTIELLAVTTGKTLCRIEDGRDAEGNRTFAVKQIRMPQEKVAAKDALWISKLFVEIAKIGRPDRPGSRVKVAPVSLHTRAKARDLFDRASKDTEGRLVAGFVITPYMLRHQFMADCKLLSGGDAEKLTEMTGNKSSWRRYGGRCTGSKNSLPSFTEVRRVTHDAATPGNAFTE
ncbi:MAG: hypothetical protein VR70_10820 [Rhodospirillaceae bacterium BRH_c57]|nr:MAG: hypothetical protein VR70_10820 [Rhodospirillaceae bacterium BRH_c57]